MPLEMQMMDAWRERSNRAYQELMLAQSAPALFKPERIEHLREELENSERQFNFWRSV